jgi:hypothetical protein
MPLVAAARGALIALTLVLFAPVASGSEQETYFLGPDGIPQGALVNTPRGGVMPNYDLGRDVEPGLLLERSDLGLAEAEETRYQSWQIEMSGRRLTGQPSLVIWSAPARFDPGKRGVFSVFLLDCPPVGNPCTELGAAEVAIEKGHGGVWVESTVDLPAIDHQFDDERYLAVRVVVAASSESDMMFAYGYPKQRSRLTIYPEPPVATPAETIPAAGPTAASEDELSTDKAHRLSLSPPPTVEPSDEGGSVWPWLVTLGLSTAALVALGAVLVSGLTRSGKHVRRTPGVCRSEPAQTRRMSVSAR